MRAAPPLLLVLGLLPLAHAEPDAGVIQPFTVVVEGEVATGLLALPGAGAPPPFVLVVLCHGFGAAAEDWGPDLQGLSNRGYAALAMDYRGPSEAWKVTTGARDTNAGALAVLEAIPTLGLVILQGISMGSEVAGMALAEAPPGTYDYWVADVGVSNLFELWPNEFFREAIEAETGGKPLEVPEEYEARSPVFLSEAIAGHGLRRTFIAHSAGDDIVPYSQAQELAAALSHAGAPVSTYTSDDVGHFGFGQEITRDRARDRPDWAVPLVQGYFRSDVEFVPPLGP